MASVRSIGVATIMAGAVLVTPAVAAPGSSVPATSGDVATTGEASSGSSPSSSPPPTVPPFTAGPTTSTTTVVTTPGETSTTLPPDPAAGELVLPDEPLGPEALEVVNALYEARVLFLETLMDPTAPDLDERLDGAYARSSPARTTLEEYRAQLRADGLRAYPNSSIPWALHIEPSVTFYELPFPRSVVRACNIDSAILYEPGGGPDGSDVVVNDEVYAAVVDFTMVPEDSRWQLWSVVLQTEPLLGVTTCAAS